MENYCLNDTVDLYKILPVDLLYLNIVDRIGEFLTLVQII